MVVVTTTVGDVTGAGAEVAVVVAGVVVAGGVVAAMVVAGVVAATVTAVDSAWTMLVVVDASLAASSRSSAKIAETPISAMSTAAGIQTILRFHHVGLGVSSPVAGTADCGAGNVGPAGSGGSQFVTRTWCHGLADSLAMIRSRSQSDAVE